MESPQKAWDYLWNGDISKLKDVDAEVVNIDNSSRSAEDWLNLLNDIDKRKNEQWIAQWGAETQGTIRTQEDLVKANEKARQSVIDYNESLQANGLGSKLKNFGLDALSMISNVAMSMAIGAGIELITNAIYETIHATEIAIEKGEEARSTISSLHDEYSKKASTVNNSGERFDELRKRVNQQTNENISLTNDEYSEYLSLCNEIAAIYPTLVTGYDAQNNAILNLGSSAQSATEQLQSMLEVDQQIANLEIAKNLGTAYKGTAEIVKQLQKEKSKLEGAADAQTSIIDYLNQHSGKSNVQLSDNDNSIGSQLVNLLKGDVGYIDLDPFDEYYKEKVTELENILNEAGISFSDVMANAGSITLPDGNVHQRLAFDGLDLNKLKSYFGLDDTTNTMSKLLNDLAQKRNQNIYEAALKQNQINSEWASLIQDAIIPDLNSEVNFTSLDDKIQSSIVSAVNNFDLSKIPQSYIDNNDINGFVYDTFVKPISYAFADVDGNNEIQESFNDLFNLDTSSLNAEEYKSAIEKNLSQIHDFYISAFGDEGETLFKDFTTTFGFKTETYFGQLVSSFDVLLGNLKERFPEDFASDLNLLDGLTVEEILGIDELIYDPSWGGTFVDAIEQIKGQTQTAIDSTEPITFSSLFEDDAEGNQSALSKAVDDFQSDISSIQSSIDSLKSGEKVSFADLVQEFPELEGQADNLNVALENLKVDKIREFSEQWKEVISGLTGEDAKKASQFFKELINELDLSDVDLSTLQDGISNVIADFSPNKATAIMQEFSDELQSQEGAAILLKVLLDPANAEAGLKQLKAAYENEEIEMNLSIDEEIADTSSILSQINALNSVISSQSTGASIDIDTFNSEELADYQSALEYVNGTMQLNAEKVREITEAKVDELIATNDVTKAQKQSEYLQNAKEIETLRQKIEDNNFATGESADSIQAQIDSLLESNNAIVSQCGQLDLLNASLRESIGTYQAWKDAQNASESGDMFDDTLTAIQKIDDVLNNTDSDMYGRVGREDYKTSLDLIVPDTVDKEDENAINSYLNSIDSLFTHEDGGRAGLNIEEFCQQAMDKGLMVLDEESESYKVAGGKTMEDFAEGLNLAMPLVQALFGEMEEFGGVFDWSDEAVKTIGDLAVEANQAAESLKGIEGNETLKINLDVSEFETKEEKISALDSTIQEMNTLKVQPGVDTSQIDEANAVIQYCVAQKQQLDEPAVMSVDTSLVQGEIGNAISLLQQFQTAQNTLEMQAAVGMDTTEAQANVDALVQQIQGINPKVSAELDIDTTSADSITASLAALTPEMMVKAGIDDTAIIGYTAEDKEGTVRYGVDKSAVDSYSPSNKSAKVVYTPDTSALPTTLSPLRREVQYYKTGDVGVNGTAHVNGTANNSLSQLHSYGRACLNGDWGTKKSGTTLVGELGREIVVNPRTGKWYTVGDNGAEFVDIPKGSIVFNHIQSQSLLEQGYVAARGTALASGTAMVTGGIKVSNAKKSTDTSSSTSSSSSATTTAKKASTVAKSTSKSIDKILESLEKLYDWIAVRLERLQQKIDLYEAKSDNAVGYQNKNKNLTSAQTTITALISANESGAAEYKKKANAVAKQVGLSSSLKKKVDNGTINIQSLSEDNKKRVEAYKEWYLKMPLYTAMCNDNSI